MKNTKYLTGIALLLIGLSIAIAVTLTASQSAHADPGILYAAPAAVGSGNCSDWDNACTLQTALANAVSGDEIWVKMGVHYPGAAGNRTATFTLKNGVAIYGGFAGTETLRSQRNPQTHITVLSGDIDRNDLTDPNGVVTTTANIVGNNAYHVVTGGGTDSTAVLDGFTITAGQANGSYPHNYGGGMYNDSSSPTLTDITFSGNSANSGGGMYNYQSRPTLTDIIFSSNSASYGGGGMCNYFSNPTLTNVTFGGNSAYSGGGMHNDSSSPTLTDVTFSGNSATNRGGGMYNDHSSPTLTGVTFSGNSANTGGGLFNGWVSSPTLTDVTFSGNSAYNGGGMYNYDSRPTLINVTFSGNSATNQGGGMYNWYGNPTLANVAFSGNSAAYSGGGMYNYYSSPTLTNITFSGNTAANSGGGMHNSGSNLTLANVILWGDSALMGSEIYNDNSTPVISYSDIQGCGGSGSWNSACGADGGNNIDADPLFVDAAGGNLRLQAGSPAIDASNDAAVPAGITTDLDGNPRFSGATVDMGAYEYQNPTTYHRLSVYLSGEGVGRVQSAPAGIACPGDCRQGYLPATIVVLTATPGATSAVAGWAGCDSVAGNTCTLTMTSARSVTVTLSHTAGVLYAAPVTVGSGNCLSWGNACTLQTALDNAARGDEIWVKAGVHYPGAAGERTATFTLKNGVAIYGGFAGTETARDQRDPQAHITILSGDIDRNDLTDPNGVVTTTANIVGDNAYHVVTGGGTDSTAVLDGFTITAGQANGSYPNFHGGGIYNDQSSPTLTNLTFSGNSASWYGGGMYNYQGNPTLTDVTFSGNSASSGGGMYNWYSNPMLTDVAFSGNSASSGGGMYNWYSNPMLTDVTFSGNLASDGGGMYNSRSSPTLTNATFIGNSATYSSGGMYNYGGIPKLTNVTFNGNSATRGGGMYNQYSGPTLINATFSGNSATDSGGGMYNSGGIVTLVNVIMWGDSAPSGPEIYNSSSTPAISYSDIQGCGGSGSWDNACGTDGGGNIDADPLFVDAAAGNLRLQLTSPAVDAGNNAAVPASVTTDLDGNPRFVDIPTVPDTGNGAPPIVDMGAYEVPLNRAPVFTSTPVLTATQGVTYTYAVAATDPDLPYGDVLTVTAPITLPAWLTLTDHGDGTATLSGIPTNAHIGSHPVTLKVTDSGGLFAEQSFTVTVTAKAGYTVFLPLVVRNTP